MRRLSSEHLVSEVEGRVVQRDSQEYLVLYYTSENDLPSLVRLLGSTKVHLHKLKKISLTIPGRNFVAFKGKEMRDHKRAKDSAARFALMWLLSEGFIIPAQWASLQPFK